MSESTQDTRTHEQKMADKAAAAGVTVNGQKVVVETETTTDSTANTNNQPATRPDYIPEKFWDAEKGVARYEELARSYTELERSRSTQSNSTTEPKQETPAPGTDEGNTANAAAPKTMDILNGAVEEQIKTGTLSAKTLEALGKAGLDKSVIDSQVSSMRDLANKTMKAAYDVVNGEENYKAMQAWANETLSPEERDQFSAMATDPKTTLFAVKALWSRFQVEGPKEGNLTLGNGSENVGGDVFKSQQELTAAMQDPRYKSDAAYRKEVQAKAVRSTKAGTLRKAFK